MQDHTTTDHNGKDKTKDGETAASSETNRDHSWDQEARDATLAKTIAEAVAREVAKAHVQYQAIANEKSTPTCQPALKYLQDHMASGLWTPLIGQRTNLSTRDGNYGHIRLDSPLMPWRERFSENQDFLLPPLDQWGWYHTD